MKRAILRQRMLRFKLRWSSSEVNCSSKYATSTLLISTLLISKLLVGSQYVSQYVYVICFTRVKSKKEALPQKMSLDQPDLINCWFDEPSTTLGWCFFMLKLERVNCLTHLAKRQPCKSCHDNNNSNSFFLASEVSKEIVAVIPSLWVPDDKTAEPKYSFFKFLQE